MHTLNLFIQLVQEHRYWGYTLLFFAMIFEGELFLSATGMLVGIRAFDPFDAFFFAFSGVIFGDLLWYWLGRYLGRKHSHRGYVDWTINRVRRFLPGLEKNPYHIVFVSKFIYGLNHSAILVLGYLKTDFRHFLKVQFITSFLWTVLFLALGYVFGEAALAYTHRLDKLLAIFVLFILTLVVVERYVKRALKKNVS